MLNEVDPSANRSTANGTTTVFAYTFRVDLKTDIDVLVDATVKTVDTDYTVDGLGNSGGGNITFLSAPTNGAIVTRLRKQPASQLSVYTANEGFPHTRVMADLDLLAMQIQQVREQLHRGFFLPKSSSLADQGIDAPTVGAFARGKSGGGIDWATPTLAGALSSPVSISDGGTGATSAAGARAAILLQSTTTQQGIVELATNAEVLTGTDTDRAVTPSGVAAAIVAALAPASFTTVVSYTGTDTLDAGVGLALLSGASFAFTLQAAASYSGREVDILHQGTSLTQIYTITGNGAENIIALDGTANTYILYTNGERIRLKSDGTSWYVLAHEAQTKWVDAGVMTITGTASNPTKPTTPDYDKVFWRRDGKDCLVKFILQISSAAGSAAGSGTYLFLLPASIAIDAIISPVGTAWATATMSEGLRAGLSGQGKVVIDSSSFDQLSPFAYDTTHVQWVREAIALAISSAGYPVTSAEAGYYLECRFPAANWRA